MIESVMEAENKKKFGRLILIYGLLAIAFLLVYVAFFL